MYLNIKKPPKGWLFNILFLASNLSACNYAQSRSSIAEDPPDPSTAVVTVVLNSLPRSTLPLERLMQAKI